MSNQQPLPQYQAHLDALEQHQQLLAKLHLDANARQDELAKSLENVALTLEEYLKILGIP